MRVKTAAARVAPRRAFRRRDARGNRRMEPGSPTPIAEEETRTMERPRQDRGRHGGAAKTIAALALALAVIGLLFLASASVGYHVGWWSLGAAFTILRFSVYAAIAVAVLAVI